jgi:hypothetical protein
MECKIVDCFPSFLLQRDRLYIQAENMYNVQFLKSAKSNQLIIMLFLVKKLFLIIIHWNIRLKQQPGYNERIFSSQAVHYDRVSLYLYIPL